MLQMLLNILKNFCQPKGTDPEAHQAPKVETDPETCTLIHISTTFCPILCQICTVTEPYQGMFGKYFGEF